MSSNVRHVKQRSAGGPFLAAVVLLAVGTWAALELGGHWDTGEWPNPNPSIGITKWVQDGRHWSVSHSVAAGLVGIAVVGLIYAVALLSARKAIKAEHIDSRAKYMGDGTTMSLKAVTTHAVEAKLTVSDVPGLMLAKSIQTGEWLWAGFRESLTAIMGPGSGKTSALVVPMALEAPGALWVTSNRNDVVAAIRGPRSKKGRVWEFDPQQVAGSRPTFRWDPLNYIIGADGDTTGAEVRAGALAKMFAEAGRPLETKTDAFFDPAGQQLLGNLMLAARLGGFQITKCFEWLSKSLEEKEPVSILWNAGFRMQADFVRSKYRIYDKTKGSIFETATGMISFLANQPALPWVISTGPDDDRPVFDPAAFVRSTDTMVCMSREGHMSFAPIVAALTTALIEAAEEYAKTCPRGRLPVALAMLLDEVANVCRIKILPDLMSHSGGRGIFVMPILQSRAQGEDAWGKTGMEKMWGASTIKILGRGISEVQVLKDWSELVGPQDVITHSRSTSSGKGGGSKSTGEHRTSEPILTPSMIGYMPSWRCLVWAAGAPVVLAELVPYFRRSKEMNAEVELSQAAYEKELITV
jgi:hypothetical protein